MDKIPPRLLLHVCCAPCLVYPVRLLQKDFEVVAYFYDPNIHPKEEYDLRLNEARSWAAQHELVLLETPYDTDRWFQAVRGYEKEPERGKRCAICFSLRLDQTAAYAVAHHFDIFTTVLTISSKKDSKQVNDIGKKIGEKYGIPFLEADFKKSGGALKALELSKFYSLRRQTYCGCIYSV